MRNAFLCEVCSAVHLMQEHGPCPACRGAVAPTSLTRAQGEPERFLPRTVDAAAASRALTASHRIWFPCPDASAENLAKRLQPIWWPYWMVDVDARAVWQAEVGFDYEVESSVEKYDGGQWRSVATKDRRTRWEARSGTLIRHYPNVAVSALATQPFDRAMTDTGSEDFTSDTFDGTIRVPDRPPSERWDEALHQIRHLAGHDCGLAVGADRVREVYLDLDPEQASWTWLLVPGWLTWYVDDDGRAHVLRVDGADGGVEGRWAMSPARGRTIALVHGVVAATLLLGALGCFVVGLVLWFLLPVALVLGMAGVVEGCVAAFCLWRPGAYNATPG